MTTFIHSNSTVCHRALPSDVSGNSLYGRINRNFKNMVADGDALINLAHNFFFGDAVLFAAGCQVCPTEISDPNSLDMGDTFDVLAGKCNNVAATSSHYFSVAGAGKEARVGLLGNCLTLRPDGECSSNATQRSTAACQAFCSIIDNGPCDGHGDCVTPAPASPSNFTCLCHAGYSTLDAGNGSTYHISPFVTLTIRLSPPLSTSISSSHLILPPLSPLHLPSTTLPPQSPPSSSGPPNPPHCAVSSLSTGAIVRAMASLHHSHLVRLLGFCLDQNVETGKQEQILVYEFVGNRDLDYHIHVTKSYKAFAYQRMGMAVNVKSAFDLVFVCPDLVFVCPDLVFVCPDLVFVCLDLVFVCPDLVFVCPDLVFVCPDLVFVCPDLVLYARTSSVFDHSPLSLLPSIAFARYHSPWRHLSSLSFFLAWTPLQSIISPFLDAHQARKKIEVFELDELKDSKMPAVIEEAIVEFADLALDCMKSPGTRRPSMTEMVYRLTALIAKHCPDKEDEWGSIVKEESSSNGGLPSTNVSAVSYGGRDSRMSSDSHPSASSSMSIGLIADGVRSWLHLKPTSGY
ncbi:unnamed protein product [Closterium sp. Naga37s-1]|nr:unnamed protein product [Closterium sp. Naga37s-1]